MDNKELVKMWKSFLIDIEKSETDIANMVDTSQQNLNRKIRMGTIRYMELSEIVEKFGYTIAIQKKNK